MEQYINKDALVAKLNRIISELIIEEGENTMFEEGKISAFEDVKLFLDSLPKKYDVAAFILKQDAEWKEHQRKIGLFGRLYEYIFGSRFAHNQLEEFKEFHLKNFVG